MIRKAEKRDIPAVAAIYDELHTAEEAGEVTIGWIRDVYPTADTAEQALARGDLFVEEEEGTVVGAAIINQTQVDVYRDGSWRYEARESEVMVLHTLVISPRAGKKGYGSRFVEFYEQYALDHGCRYLRMDTNMRNSRARAMYKRLGYSEIGIVPCVFNGIEGVRLVLLEKRLEQARCEGEAGMVRVMSIEDYPALIALWKRTPNMGLRSLDDSEEGIGLFLKRNPTTSFAAYEGERLVGAILCGHDGRRGYIYHTVVLPEYRRRGIATALVNAAVAALREEGITRVCLNVVETNEGGKVFWTGKGWEKKDFLGFYSRSITDRENLPLWQ